MACLFVAYLLNIIDYLFTARWVKKFGIEIEGNPIGRWLFNHNMAGAFKIFAVGGIFAIVGYFITHYPKYAWVAYIPLAVYALICVYHVIIWVRLAFIK